MCVAYKSKKNDILREYALYASTMPKATQEIDKILKDNTRFNTEITGVLRNANKLHLGYLHFILRPVQKIARYALLFKAVEKYAKEREEKKLNEIATEFVEASKKVNQNVEYSTSYFALYHTAKEIDTGTKTRKIVVAMMQIQRKLVHTEDEVYIVLGSVRKPVSMVVLDNCVFFLETQVKEDTMLLAAYKKKLLNDFMPMESIVIEKVYIEEHKIEYQLIIKDRNSKYIVECTEGVRDTIYNHIVGAIEEKKKAYAKLDVQRTDVCVKGTNVSFDIVDDVQETEECVDNSSTQKDSSTHTFSIASLGTVIAGSTSGLHIIKKGEVSMVMQKQAKSVEYIRELQSVLYMRDRRVYYMRIDNGEVKNKEIKLTSKVETAMIRKTKLDNRDSEEVYLVAKQVGYLGTEELLIVKLKNKNKMIEHSLYRRMYMAGDISSVAFFGNHFAIASNDFELIDLKDLTTQELLNPLDMTISIFVDKMKSKPISIHKTEANRFLVVFDDVGLFVNKFGTRKKTEGLFLWQMMITHAEIYKGYVVAVGEDIVKLYTQADGVLRGHNTIQ